MKTIQKSDDADGIKVVRSGTCPSLSGKSKLTYHVGLSQTREVLLRVVQNSNSGCFSPEWVDVRALHAAFDKVPKGESVTADNLVTLFRGKSMNTPFFLFAVMKCEGLVEASKTDKRRYERVDPKGFIAGVQGTAGSAQPKGGATKLARPAGQKKSTPSKKG
jgi:hypothetical protein